MKVGLILLVFLLLTADFSYSQTAETSKINGLSLVSKQFVLDSSHVKPLVELGANYAAVIPFCFMPKIDSSVLVFGSNNFWKGESPEGVQIAIKELHKKMIKTMIKPQVWVGHGIYTGEIEMKSEESWTLFEKNYTDYIMAFAKIAEEENVDLFCIGNELRLVVKQRPNFLPTLLKKVRGTYSGKITYAENWDCFNKVDFWGELDFIGVNAYFPISDTKNPSMRKLKKGWSRYLEVFDSLYVSMDKKILFTEYGYRSVKYCAKSPWDYSKEGYVVCQKSQSLALKALYKSVWDKHYFAGGFLWKWHPNDGKSGGQGDLMFTVQNKEAEEIVRKQFLK